MKPKTKLTLALLFWAFSVSVIFIYGYSARYLTCWDAVPYSAVQKTIKSADKDFAEVHREVYSLLESEFKGLGYENIAFGSEYAAECKDNPEALRQQMRFYTVKPAYNYFNVLLSSFGMNELDALFANTFMFGVLLYLLIHFYLWKSIGLAGSLFVAPLVFVFSGCSALMNTATTPDLMLAFFSLAALLLVAEQKFYWGLALLLLTIPIRGDSAIRYFLVVIIIAINSPEYRKQMCFAFVIGLAGYYSFTQAFVAYPWSVLYYHSHIGRLSYPEMASVSVPIADYLRKLATSTHFIFDAYMLTIFAPVPFLLRGLRPAKAIADLRVLLVLGCAAFFVLHYLLHPEVNIRYFLTDSLFVMIAAIGRFWKSSDTVVSCA